MFNFKEIYRDKVIFGEGFYFDFLKKERSNSLN